LSMEATLVGLAPPGESVVLPWRPNTVATPSCEMRYGSSPN
jgi:hypothetical protein